MVSCRKYAASTEEDLMTALSLRSGASGDADAARYSCLAVIAVPSSP